MGQHRWEEESGVQFSQQRLRCKLVHTLFVLLSLESQERCACAHVYALSHSWTAAIPTHRLLFVSACMYQYVFGE